MEWIDEFYALCITHRRVILPFTGTGRGVSTWDVPSNEAVDHWFDYERERIGTPKFMKTYTTMRAAKKNAIKRSKIEDKAMTIVYNTHYRDLVVRTAPYISSGSLFVVAETRKDENGKWEVVEDKAATIPEKLRR